MNIFGIYKIYEDGKEIACQKNTITKFGKRFLTEYLAGIQSFNGKAIAIGSGSSASTVDDTQLDFEFYRSPVNFGSINIDTSGSTTTYSVVYKTTLPSDIAGIITETGLYPSEKVSYTQFDSKFISTFEDNLAWTNSAGNSATLLYTPTPGVGTAWMQLTNTNNQGEYYAPVDFNMSGYSVNDTLTLAFNQQDTNLNYVYVRFYSSSSDYYEARFLGNGSTGYKVLTLSLGSIYNSLNGSNTTVDLYSINKIIVGVTASSGTTSVLLDGLRINDTDTFDPIHGLISRAKLTTPITKSLGKQIDIEYQLGVNF